MRMMMVIAAIALTTTVLLPQTGQTRYVNLSFGALFSTGGASVSGTDLRELQGGAHDPRVTGFTVQNLELSLTGAIDPFLNGEVHLIFQIDAEGESLLEVEEAFLTTRSMPLGLQVRAGAFFTGFGRLNPQHPHSWSYVDQPLVNNRFLGGDGLRGPGGRISWLTPLPWYSELTGGLQNANGETAVSFLGSPEEELFLGRPLVQREAAGLADLLKTFRWLNAFTPSSDLAVNLGLTGLFGPNRTGADGRTTILGGDLFAKWQPPATDQGWPFVTLQIEGMLRQYFASANAAAGHTAATLEDAGWYGQVQWGFKRGWIAGLRHGQVYASGGSADGTADRSRWSANLSYYPSEFSKVRLQANLDDGAFLGRESIYGIWLQFEFLMGQHAGHKF